MTRFPDRLPTRLRGAVRSAAALCLSAALLAPVSASAQAEAPPLTGASFGALRTIFYHELGHGLIDVLGLGVVGPEEDVVDEFATYMLILTGRGDDRQIEALFSTARFWKAAGEGRRGAFAHWGEHPPDERRFYAILCLLHGSDPGRFYPLMTEFGVPQTRARKCEVEYAEKEGRWIDILSPHLRSPQNPDQAGLQVFYAPAQSDSAEAVAQVWRQTRFLESLAGEAGAIFGLPQEIPIVGRECGFANAFWDGASITLCYEMQSAIETALTAPARPASGATPAASAAGAAARAAAAAATAGAAAAQPPAAAAPTPPAASAPASGARNIGDSLGASQ
ncbi:MAG: DUF4344 domain-containing metallopeptidase [Rubrimonas sp.]|uniref:DUF4344 domain-containing metallopeptidase n=1 Tax=Rubrimonas sp. TaxID=2036015 RepID=UPI002FDD544A